MKTTVVVLLLSSLVVGIPVAVLTGGYVAIGLACVASSLLLTGIVGIAS